MFILNLFLTLLRGWEQTSLGPNHNPNHNQRGSGQSVAEAELELGLSP